MNNKRKRKPEHPLGKEVVPLYYDPGYPADEDIFNREKKELFIEDGNDVNPNGDETEVPLPGEDLDIPGAELDDVDEDIGAEDEENNYYSLGGDNHKDLDEHDG